MATCIDVPLKLIKPEYDSKLLDVIIELDRLRHIRLAGSTPASIFFQIKEIFHMLESLESARIEGNRTTISEYVDIKIDQNNQKHESIWELENIEKAMKFAENQILSSKILTNNIIREIHLIVVDGLTSEGDATPGAYRKNKNVAIQLSNHKPPDWTQVQAYMSDLVDFINQEDNPKYDLLKVAIAHHRFTWIHPFGNGNGRVVRILTYLLLIKYGFKPQSGGRILNPTAVFCNNREQYYEMLAKADTGSDEGLEEWSYYILSGINQELNRVDQLTDYDYLKKKVLVPAIFYSHDRNIINDIEKKILIFAINKEQFKASDLAGLFPDMDSRKRSYQIKKLIEMNMIIPIKQNARTYHIRFNDSALIRGIIFSLKAEGFTSSLEH